MSTVYASPIWLGRPHCPVTVTTGAGAVVTAALGSLTLTATADANGLCAMKLPRRGRWSFTAVLGGKKGFGTLAVPGREVFPCRCIPPPWRKIPGPRSPRRQRPG